MCYISFARLMNDFVGSFYAQLNPSWWCTCTTFLNELTMFDIVLGKDNGTSISTEKVSIFFQKLKINTQHLLEKCKQYFGDKIYDMTNKNVGKMFFFFFFKSSIPKWECDILKKGWHVFSYIHIKKKKTPQQCNVKETKKISNKTNCNNIAVRQNEIETNHLSLRLFLPKRKFNKQNARQAISIVRIACICFVFLLFFSFVLMAHC